MKDRNKDKLKLAARVVNGVLLEEVTAHIAFRPEPTKDWMSSKQKAEIFVLASAVGYLTAITEGCIGNLNDFIILSAVPDLDGDEGIKG